MASRRKNYHVGGEQLPLIVPESGWKRLKELPDLRRVGTIALDRECRDGGLASGRGPGWATRNGHTCGHAIAWRAGGQIRSAYLPTRHPDSANFDPEQVARWERDHQKAGVTFVMCNAPYDVGWGDVDGVPCPERVEDVSCMDYMLDENFHDYGLDAICRRHGVPGKDEKLLREAIVAYGFPAEDAKSHLWRLPARYVGPYAEPDAIATLRVFEEMKPKLEKDAVWEAYRLEADLIPMVHAMRKRGIRVDVEAGEKLAKDLSSRAARLFEEMSEKLGHTFGIDEVRSASWMERTCDALKIRFPRTSQGQGSFDKSWMRVHEHWFPREVQRAKSLHEASEKFVRGFVLDFASNERLHASINQFKSEDGYGTKTYRFSYSAPPLQQMPNRDEELASLIRGLFLPEEGDVWLAADYSQQEYRLIVHFAELFKLTKAQQAADKYRNDPATDFHSMVAEMTGLDRKPAKDSNFAKSYGAGIPKFALMINKSVAEAEAIMKQYDEEMPFVSQMNQKVQKKAERTGFVRLLDGARVHWNTWEAAWLSKEERARGWGSGGRIPMGSCSIEEARRRAADPDHPWYGKRLRRAECRKAMNALIQGSAARQTKMAMRACFRAGHVPLLQMHDELDFSIGHEPHVAEIAAIMRDVVKLRVPMKVDAECGATWGKAKATKTYDASFRAARAALKMAA